MGTKLLSCCCLPRLAKQHDVVFLEVQPVQTQLHQTDVAFGVSQTKGTSTTANQRTSMQRSSTKESVATVYDLPPGWKAVTSRSRPDRTAFLNEFTGERISWVPTEPASTVKGEIRRSKRRSKVNNERDSMQSSESDVTVTRASFEITQTKQKM